MFEGISSALFNVCFHPTRSVQAYYVPVQPGDGEKPGPLIMKKRAMERAQAHDWRKQTSARIMLV